METKTCRSAWPVSVPQTQARLQSDLSVLHAVPRQGSLCPSSSGQSYVLPRHSPKSWTMEWRLANSQPARPVMFVVSCLHLPVADAPQTQCLQSVDCRRLSDRRWQRSSSRQRIGRICSPLLLELAAARRRCHTRSLSLTTAVQDPTRVPCTAPSAVTRARASSTPLGHSISLRCATGPLGRLGGACLSFSTMTPRQLTFRLAVRLGEWAMRAECGAVGAKLLYPNGPRTARRPGLGSRRLCGASGKWRPRDDAGPLCMLRATREVAAVTGACLAVEKDKFD